MRNLNYKSVLVLVLGNLAVFFALLIAVEAFLWIAWPIGDPDRQSIRFTQNIPGVKPEILYEEIAPGVRSLSAVSLAKPKDVFRVLCIGASTTQQLTQQIEDTWCAIAEKNLRQSPAFSSRKIQTISVGFGGYRAKDVAIWLRENYSTVQPDIVVTLLGINDMTANGGPGYRQRNVKEEIRNKEHTFASDEKSWISHCKRLSQLCRLVILAKHGAEIQLRLRQNTAVEWHTKNIPRLKEKYQSYPYVERPTRDQDPFEEFVSAVEEMSEFLQDRKASTILLGQPVLWKAQLESDEPQALWFGVNTGNGPVRPSMEWILREMQRYNRAQQDIASRFNSAYLDLDALIPKTLEYYFDDCHFTDKGSAKLAEALTPLLERVTQQRLTMH